MEMNYQQIPILTYHKISKNREWGINTVSPQKFHHQLSILKTENFTSINFHHLLDKKVPPKPIIITFDDGYESVFENAIPALSEFGFTAAIFIVTGHIGKLNTWDANIGGNLVRHLNRQQIHELAQNKIEIGTHGISHRPFTYLTGKEADLELRESKRLLEQITGGNIISMAYPFGMQNKLIQSQVEKSGYKFACVNLFGASNHLNPFAIRRIPVYSTDSSLAFKSKLNNGFSNKIELAKLKVLNWPAFLTPIYQKFIKKYDSNIQEI
jgi:peptidoglycan/xylan/chitin deacetylase (PgdA/CDA1 family)